MKFHTTSTKYSNTLRFDHSSIALKQFPTISTVWMEAFLVRSRIRRSRVKSAASKDSGLNTAACLSSVSVSLGFLLSRKESETDRENSCNKKEDTGSKVPLRCPGKFNILPDAETCATYSRIVSGKYKITTQLN